MADLTDLSARDRLPIHTLDALDRYVNDHLEPGSFLRAVLENDLREAFGRADYANRYALYDIVSYCWNYIPYKCWGSPKAVKAWLARPEKEVVQCQK
jgi:hypothetical protein